MIYLRFALFLGLVLHKLIWEGMKVRKSRGKEVVLAQKPGLKTLLKGGKVLFLLFLVIQTLFLDLLPITENDTPIRVAGLILYITGWLTAVIGRLQLGKNWANLEDYAVLSGQNLVQSGIYAHIRHPIYIGDLLLITGLELALNSWLVLLVIPILLVVFKQAVAEEKVLSAAFPGYQDYKNRTKMFVPYLI